MSDNFQTSGRSFPNSTNSFCILYYFPFHFLILCSNLHLNFLSLKLSATGDRPFHLFAMEQSLEHDNSMQKNFSERVARVQREKSNKCSLCDYASSRASNLRTHLKTHSGEKSNKCNLCDFASVLAGNLRTHLKTHGGEKSNKCNQCGYASSYASDLRRHLKMHSGEKSNKCNLCDFASVHAGNLKTFENARRRKVKQMQSV